MDRAEVGEKAANLFIQLSRKSFPGDPGALAVKNNNC
jgi:hypothetical protein